MKWFKHDSDATQDAKVKKLIIRHGATGYAVYFHCLELISSDVSASNMTFELEHDSEIIADTLRVKGTADRSGREIVEDIMLSIVDLKLFENIGGHIFCFKLLKRLDTSMSSNKLFRKMIDQAKKSHDTVMIQSCKNRIEENKKDIKRGDAYAKEGEKPNPEPFIRIDLPSPGMNTPASLAGLLASIQVQA